MFLLRWSENRGEWDRLVHGAGALWLQSFESMVGKTLRNMYTRLLLDFLGMDLNTSRSFHLAVSKAAGLPVRGEVCNCWLDGKAGDVIRHHDNKVIISSHCACGLRILSMRESHLRKRREGGDRIIHATCWLCGCKTIFYVEFCLYPQNFKNNAHNSK